MKLILGFIAFMLIWCAGCYATEQLLSDLNVCWIMVAGFYVGKIGIATWKFIAG